MLRSFARLLTGLGKSFVPPADRKRLRTVLGVTPLEDRTVPAAIPAIGPNGGEWVKVDTITVATKTNQNVSTGVPSNVVLDAGVTYLAVASGTARIATDATGFADAEFIRYNKSTGPQDGSSPGYAWNNHGVRIAGVDGGDTTGNLWGAYQTDHQYVREFVGQGTKVTGYYSDIPGYYGDNSGTLQVDLYAEVPLVSVTATDTGEGSATGGFTFTRTGDLSGPLTVTYSVGGTATPGADYTPLSGTITFAAGEDQVEVPVEAFGDNTADDGETVTATITAGVGYALDTAATTATVVINDQALTVSVQQVNDAEERIRNDGEQAGKPGLFRFIRAGDLTAPLTVAYTVSGTATAGSDYAALSGTVTFGPGLDTVDVPVVVIDDADAEPTETVTVTLAASEEYQLGNDADTLFVRDNDTTKYIWVSNGSHDWNDPANWSTDSVPTTGSDVYFDGNYSPFDCINVGDGLSTLGGLHLVNGYPGTATLANALSLGDFEEASGTLNQPIPGYDLTVTGTMLWTSGTLNALNSGTALNLIGAVGRLDPPDAGSVATASTLRLINNALITFLPGALNFTAGEGIFVDAKVKGVTKVNAATRINKATTATDAKIVIGDNGKFYIDHGNDLGRIGRVASQLPIQSSGSIFIEDGIHFEVNGHVDNNNGPSLLMTSGSTTLTSSSSIVSQFGTTITGGEFEIHLAKVNSQARMSGKLTLSGGTLSFLGVEGARFGKLLVDGDIFWSGGRYVPLMDGSIPGIGSDKLIATGRVRFGDNAILDAKLVKQDNVPTGSAWSLLIGRQGIAGKDPSLSESTAEGNYVVNWNVDARPAVIWELKKR